MATRITPGILVPILRTRGTSSTGPERVGGSKSHENLSTSRDKEEVADGRVVERLGLGAARFDVPVGPKRLLDLLPHLDELIQIIARRREQDTHDEIAVARRKIF